VSATAAVAKHLKASPEWRRFYRQCCEAGALRLRSQAWQFRDELRERGAWFELEEVEDALLAIARKVLPRSAAAQWDPDWGHQLCKDALARAAALYGELSEEERNAADLVGAEAEWIDRANAAVEANDPAAFRAAVKGWERALVEALEGARMRPGAA
jgi:hypothetical protein